MFSNIINAKQLEEQLSLPFFHFPSPYCITSSTPYDFESSSGVVLEDFDLFLSQHHELLSQYQQQPSSLMKTTTPDDSLSEIVSPQTNRSADVMPDSSKTGESAPVVLNSPGANVLISQKLVPPKKRSSKKDRHSKINTAQGPRDRRMRLSLEVARNFFGLQDLLGFDKASKTVEWLLLQSKSEIQKLLPQKNPSSLATKSTLSSTSECEVVSSEIDKENTISKEKPSSAKGSRKVTRQPRRVPLLPLAKDMRKKARARARARTNAKKAALSQKMNDETNQLSSLGSFEPGEESVSPMEVEEPISSCCGHQQRIDGDIVDESFALMSPSSIFNFLHNSSVPHDQQQVMITDVQAFERSWEGYNNQNLY